MFQQLLWQTIINCRTISKIKQFSKLGHFVLMNTIQKFNLRSITTVEAVNWRCSVKKVFLEISQHSQKNTCARIYFLMKLQASACNFIKKETLAQVFSCDFCETSKNNFLTEHLQVIASVTTVTRQALVFSSANLLTKIKSRASEAIVRSCSVKEVFLNNS